MYFLYWSYPSYPKLSARPGNPKNLDAVLMVAGFIPNLKAFDRLLVGLMPLVASLVKVPANAGPK